MPSKNTTRKNKPSMSKGQEKEKEKEKVDKPMATSTNEDDYISILVKTAPPTRKAKKMVPVKEPEPEPVTPPAHVPDWEKVGMSQQEFQTMMARVAKQMASWQMETYRQNMVNDLNSVSYWESRIETLEMLREPYNRKPAWSAKDILAVEDIDKQIDECERNICELEYEYEYDMEGGEVEAY